MNVVRRNGSAIARFCLFAISLFWVTLFLAGSLTPGYSQSRDATSELSALGAPYWWLNSLLGLLPMGIATTLGGILVLANRRPGALAWISGLATCVSGIGFVMAALARCDVGCEGTGLPQVFIHGLGATLALGSGLFAPLMLGLRSFGKEAEGFYRSALLAGVLYWICFFAPVTPLETTLELGTGSWQKIVIGIGNAWIVFVCLDTTRKVSGDRRQPSARRRD